MTKAGRAVLLVAVLVFLMIGVTGWTQRLVADKMVHDFGLAQEGERVSCEFILTNEGASAVTITRVDFDCGCTSYQLLSEAGTRQHIPVTLTAGQSLRMAVTFNTRGYARYSQPVSQTLTIDSNDPERASFQVTVRANVVTTLPSHKALPAEFVEAYFFLLDLREPEAFAEGPLFGAINIPFEELEARLPELPQKAMYVLYDADGSVAAQAAWDMANYGNGAWWGRVYSVDGGLARWIQDLGDKYFVGDSGVISQDEGGSFWVGFSLDPTAIAAKYLVVIDLSSPETFTQASIPGSVNLEEQDAVSWAQMLPDLLGLSSIAEVVLWVLDEEEGTPSCRVAQELLNLGFVASCVRGGRAALQQETGTTYLWAWDAQAAAAED
jgi:rhodanese-related sulfurtransferase